MFSPNVAINPLQTEFGHLRCLPIFRTLKKKRWSLHGTVLRIPDFYEIKYFNYFSKIYRRIGLFASWILRTPFSFITQYKWSQKSNILWKSEYCAHHFQHMKFNWNIILIDVVFRVVLMNFDRFFTVFSSVMIPPFLFFHHSNQSKSTFCKS